MFDYREFKKEMINRGHKVSKHGVYVTIVSNNNYLGYNSGFAFFQDIVDGFEKYLRFVKGEHYNTHIYEATFRIV